MRSIFLALIMLAAVMPGQCAGYTGQVVYVDVTGKAKDAPADVIAYDLATGKSTTLISHASLPKDFQTRIWSISPSPSLDYAVVYESPGAIFKFKDGREERQYGNEFHLTEEPLPGEKSIPGRMWFWERKSGKMWLMDRFKTDSARWSPLGRQLMIFRPASYSNSSKKTTLGAIWLYDVAKRSAKKLCSLDISADVRWTRDGKGFLIIDSFDEGSWVEYSPLAGKVRTLFKWPHEISAIEQSPDGSKFAIYDKTGCRIVDRKGGHAIRLKIKMLDPDPDAWPGATTLLFDKSGGKLAVYMSGMYGNPHCVLKESLWIADTGTGRATQAGYWDAMEPADSHEPVGWSDDTKSLILMQNWNVALFTPDGKDGVEETILDCGDNCLSAVYLPAKLH